MSLILDALNRARAERGEGDGPALTAPPAAAPSPSPRRTVVVLSLALGATGALLAWLALDRFGAAPPAREEAARAEAPAPPAAAEQPAAVKEDAADVPAATAEPERAAGPAPLAPAVAALYADRSGGDAPADEPSQGGEEDSGPAPVAEAPPEEAIDVAEVLARARRELGEPALEPHPAPLIAELSQQQKNAIPTLMYLRHDYTGDGRSRVQLNGEPRAAGDSVDGVRIEEILPDSVVLRHRATLFRLRALNSWVNL